MVVYVCNPSTQETLDLTRFRTALKEVRLRKTTLKKKIKFERWVKREKGNRNTIEG
jgi:hypothetical protein